jgi:predicted Fe-Mo cluster-binding NifX family protein
MNWFFMTIGMYPAINIRSGRHWHMKVAFTAWEDRISPVFDSARKLLIADVENGQIVDRQYELFNPQPVSRLVDLLKALEIEVLICGAISQTPSIIIESSGVKLVSFVGGKIDDILKSYAKGIRIVPEFSMPGCGQQCRRKRRGHNEFPTENKEVIHMPGGDGTGPQGQEKVDPKGKGRCKTGRGAQGGGKGKGSGRGGCGKGQGGGQGRGQKKGEKQPPNQRGQ